MADLSSQSLADEVPHQTRTETSTPQPRKPQNSHNRGTINLDSGISSVANVTVMSTIF